MKDDFYTILRTRRSNYTIGSRETVTPGRVDEILKLAITHTPSAFNSQPARAVALFGEHHKALWDIIWTALQQSVPAAGLKNTRSKLDGFAAGYGTILFFIDEAVVSGLAQQSPLYAAQFTPWAEQSTGMLQYVVWAALDNEGLGVSLQHYNPLIDEPVKKHWGISPHWRLVSQMVFGSREAPPAEKEAIHPAGKVLLYR